QRRASRNTSGEMCRTAGEACSTRGPGSCTAGWSIREGGCPQTVRRWTTSAAAEGSREMADGRRQKRA
ncbi:MAG: hypothetical protein ACK559_06580, partial [bacterium]